MMQSSWTDSLGKPNLLVVKIMEALVPVTVVSKRHQGKFYPRREALRKQIFWPRLSLAACSPGPARWWVLALTTIYSPGPAPHATTTFFCTVHLNRGFQTLDMRNLFLPWASGCYICMRGVLELLWREKAIPSDWPQGSSVHNGCTKFSSRNCLFWTTSSGNIINNKVSLSQHCGISIFHPNALSLSKWHSDVFWDNSIGICQDTCWLLQTETHSSLNLV